MKNQRDQAPVPAKFHLVNREKERRAGETDCHPDGNRQQKRTNSGFDGLRYFGWDGRDRPKQMSRTADFIASVEWAWAPWSSRQDAYFLHKARSEWLLWGQQPNENDDPDHGRYIRAILASCPRQDIDENSAARLLLRHAWQVEREDFSLDAFHYLVNDGLLGADEIDEIAGDVWPEGIKPLSMTPFSDAARALLKKHNSQHKDETQ